MFVCSLLCDSDHGKLMTKCIEIIKITNAPSEVIAIICGSVGSAEDRRRVMLLTTHHTIPQTGQLLAFHLTIFRKFTADKTEKIPIYLGVSVRPVG